MKLFVNYCFISMTAIMCFLFFMVFPAMAEETYQQKAPSGTTGTQPQVSDAELEKAAEAYANVTKISHEFQQSIQGVEDKSKRVELQEAANKKMISAVENTGLDVETYNSSMAKIQANDETREKFLEKVENMQ